MCLQGSAEDKRVRELFNVIANIREEAPKKKKLKGAAKMLANGQACPKRKGKNGVEDEEEEEEEEEEEIITPPPKKPKVPAKTPDAPAASPCQRFRKKKSGDDEVLFVSSKPSKDRQELEAILAEIAAVESRREGEIALWLLCSHMA